MKEPLERPKTPVGDVQQHTRVVRSDESNEKETNGEGTDKIAELLAVYSPLEVDEALALLRDGRPVPQSVCVFAFRSTAVSVGVSRDQLFSSHPVHGLLHHRS
jgi:hypothetical protein